MTVAARVTTRYRVVQAYTYAEALHVLDFAPDERPSDAEVNKTYREKIKEVMKSNPEAIRDQALMKPLNQAKDILTGKLQPDRDPEDYGRKVDVDIDFGGFGGGNPTKDPDKVTTFEEAKAKAAIPADVKWLFVTDSHRGKDSYSSDEFSNSATGWVACGETDTHWVYVTVEHHYYKAHVPGVRDGTTDVWRVDTAKMAKKGQAPTAAELYGGVKKAWKNFQHNIKQFNSKVLDARGWRFDDKKPIGRLITIKQLVSNITGTEFTGKLKIEIAYKRGPWGEQAPAGFYKSQYGDPYRYELVINGREFTLEVADVERLSKLRIGGKPFDKRVFGDYPEHETRPKNLTLNRDGKVIMAWMAEKLAHLPDWVREALTKAADHSKAKAAYSYDRSSAA